MSKTQSGFYPAYTYTYEKHFIPPDNWDNGCQILEFESVMKQTMVYVNGEFAGSHAYGYSQFFIDISPYLKFGEENTVRVIARNEELSSRWYSGSGIYRDVNLYLSGETRIVPQKLKKTLRVSAFQQIFLHRLKKAKKRSSSSSLSERTERLFLAALTR